MSDLDGLFGDTDSEDNNNPIIQPIQEESSTTQQAIRKPIQHIAASESDDERIIPPQSESDQDSETAGLFGDSDEEDIQKPQVLEVAEEADLFTDGEE